MKRRLPQPILAPNGPRAVLLLHAYSGSSNDVRMLARRLERQGYTVYAPIFKGHGTEDPEDILTQSPETWWLETKAALAELKRRGYSQIAVFGLSMGGIFAMRALMEEGVIGGGNFCSPIMPVENHVPENFELYVRQLLESQQTDEETIRETVARMRPLVKQQVEKITEQAKQTADRLQDISVPVFLAQAGNDEMIDPAGVFQTAKALRQTRIDLRWYPESQHVITVGKDRKQLEEDVVVFVESLSWNEEE